MEVPRTWVVSFGAGNPLGIQIYASMAYILALSKLLSQIPSMLFSWITSQIQSQSLSLTPSQCPSPAHPLNKASPAFQHSRVPLQTRAPQSAIPFKKDEVAETGPLAPWSWLISCGPLSPSPFVLSLLPGALVISPSASGPLASDPPASGPSALRPLDPGPLASSP